VKFRKLKFMDIIMTMMMVVTLAACGLGVWCEVSARRAARAAAVAAEARVKVVAKEALDKGWDDGVTWFSMEWAKRMAERAVSSRDGVTVPAELVGGIADGCQVVVGKDQDFVWLEVCCVGVLYLFAHRSRDGRWLYEVAPAGNVKCEMVKGK